MNKALLILLTMVLFSCSTARNRQAPESKFIHVWSSSGLAVSVNSDCAKVLGLKSGDKIDQDQLADIFSCNFMAIKAEMKKQQVKKTKSWTRI